jgi:multiple sugar transport system ATP-binding protein
MARVLLKSVTKNFGRQEVIKDLSLEIHDKELFVLVGPSGSGKSTVLRLIAGLETPTAGDILIDDEDVTRSDPKARRVAMVFQSYALYPHMTVYDNMAFGLRMRGYSKREVDADVRATAQALGITGLLSRTPAQISGGQQQRVAVGRAIVQKPRVFLLDEPLSNLDAKLRTQTRGELLELQRSLKTTMIYVTHDQVEAMTMGDRLGVLKDGVLQQVARPLELYRYPANRFVAEFIGSPSMNFVDMVVRERPDGLWLEGGKLLLKLPPRAGLGATLLPGREVVLGMRPEDLRDRVFQPALAEEGTSAVGLVRHIEPVGAETYLTLDTGGARLVARVEPDVPYQENQPVELSFNMERAHLFSRETGERLPLEL